MKRLNMMKSGTVQSCSIERGFLAEQKAILLFHCGHEHSGRWAGKIVDLLGLKGHCRFRVGRARAWAISGRTRRKFCRRDQGCGRFRAPYFQGLRHPFSRT